MNSIAGAFAAIGMAALLALYPQESAAQGFDGASFATWSETSKTSFIEASILMAGYAGGQVDPAKGQCFLDWYFGETSKPARRAEILTAINGLPDFHPSGTILAVLSRACGSLGN